MKDRLRTELVEFADKGCLTPFEAECPTQFPDHPNEWCFACLATAVIEWHHEELERRLLAAALGAQPPADSPPPEVVKLRNQGDNAAMYADGLQQQAAPTRSTPAPQKAKRWNIACPMDGRHAVMSSPCSWCEGSGFVSIYLAKDIDRGSEGAVPAPPVNGLDSVHLSQAVPLGAAEAPTSTPPAINKLLLALTEDAAGVPAWELLRTCAEQFNAAGGGPLADRCSLMADALEAAVGVAPAGPRDEKEQK